MLALKLTVKAAQRRAASHELIRPSGGAIYDCISQAVYDCTCSKCGSEAFAMWERRQAARMSAPHCGKTKF